MGEPKYFQIRNPGTVNSIKYFIGTGCYSGLTPMAPGTAGSFVALIPLYFIIAAEIYWVVLIFVLSASILSLWASGYFVEQFGDDPPKMTIDEWAGQGLTFSAISFETSPETNIIVLLAGFLLFRFFDILKPFGINKLQNLKGGWGILADDLLAGFYALICLKTLIFMWSKFFGMA